MKVNEFIDNSDIISMIKSTFYYYDDVWNFPFGNDVGYYMIEKKSNKKLDNQIKDKIQKMELYLNDNNIKFESIGDMFDKIWNDL